MQVKCLYRNDPERDLDDPVPELGGRRFIFRIYQGDWLDPFLSWGSNWFHPPYPKYVLHVWLPIAFFIAWKWPFVNRAMYLGWKRYGVDAPEYKEWLCKDMPEEVYDGSKALCLSCRPGAKVL